MDRKIQVTVVSADLLSQILSQSDNIDCSAYFECYEITDVFEKLDKIYELCYRNLRSFDKEIDIDGFLFNLFNSIANDEDIANFYKEYFRVRTVVIKDINKILENMKALNYQVIDNRSAIKKEFLCEILNVVMKQSILNKEDLLKFNNELKALLAETNELESILNLK